MTVLVIFSNTTAKEFPEDISRVILVDLQGKSTEEYKEAKKRFKSGAIHLRLYTKMKDVVSLHNLFLPMAELFRNDPKERIEMYYDDVITVY